MLWNAPVDRDFWTTVGHLDHLGHILRFDTVSYEIYDVEKGKWSDFDPYTPHQVVPVTLPLILRPWNRADSRCLRLSPLIQHVHFVANASDLHVGPVPERYRAHQREENSESEA
jgi:hypothetical protein